jgi:hypothetical protein
MTEKKNPNMSKAGRSSPVRISKRLRSLLIDPDPLACFKAAGPAVVRRVYHARRRQVSEGAFLPSWWRGKLIRMSIRDLWRNGEALNEGPLPKPRD